MVPRGLFERVADLKTDGRQAVKNVARHVSYLSRNQITVEEDPVETPCDVGDLGARDIRPLGENFFCRTPANEQRSRRLSRAHGICLSKQPPGKG